MYNKKYQLYVKHITSKQQKFITPNYIYMYLIYNPEIPGPIYSKLDI